MTQLQRKLRLVHPTEDRLLPACFVAPGILDLLLDARSTIVSAPAGYGKSTLALIGQQSLAREWLNIPYVLREDSGKEISSILRDVVGGMWATLEQNPSLLNRLGSRAAALKYFLDRYLSIETDYLLRRLEDDHPKDRTVIDYLRTLPAPELFRPGADKALQLETLCDCLTPLGLRGVMVWIDVPGQPSPIAREYVPHLRTLFDTVTLMRKRFLHFKCLALPEICDQLMDLRSVVTLSVERLVLRWNKDELALLVERRLQALAEEQPGVPATFNELMQRTHPTAVNDFSAFLGNYSDANSPSEWLALCYSLVALTQSGECKSGVDAWSTPRHSYCAERLKIRMDADGLFWRGPRLIERLTPRKRAIYPIIKFLYEHPGYHRTYTLTNLFGIDDYNLHQHIHRARRDFLEPKFDDTEIAESAFVYLVYDPDHDGYILKHTDRDE